MLNKAKFVREFISSSTPSLYPYIVKRFNSLEEDLRETGTAKTER